MDQLHQVGVVGGVVEHGADRGQRVAADGHGVCGGCNMVGKDEDGDDDADKFEHCDRNLKLAKHVGFGEADTKAKPVAVAAEPRARRAVFCCVGVDGSFKTGGRRAEERRACENCVGGNARAAFGPFGPSLKRADECTSGHPGPVNVRTLLRT